MTREQHLAWCKKRALEYVDKGDLANGVTSMISDMDKHDETRFDPKSVLGMLGLLALQQAVQGDRDGFRRFIVGFN